MPKDRKVLGHRESRVAVEAGRALWLGSWEGPQGRIMSAGLLQCFFKVMVHVGPS